MDRETETDGDRQGYSDIETETEAKTQADGETETKGGHISIFFCLR
jgi:hypothetical protein